jgi:predicted ribosomally synthesized peptide with nif11-like leader
MSEDQLTALLAKLKEDAELLEKLNGASKLDKAVAIAKEAGFDVSKADWLRYQAKQTLELSDEELEGLSGGDADTLRQKHCVTARGWTDRRIGCKC